MLRIGVAFPGDPSEASTWSGTPSGVLRGLAEAGAEPVPINVAPAPLVSEAVVNAIALRYLRPQRDVRAAISRGRAAGWASPGLARVNSIAAARAVRAAGSLDGIVQIGTGYTVDSPAPIATLEDMTVAQTRERGRAYAGWDTLTPRAFAARLERQRRAYASATAVCLTSRWAADSVLRDYGVPEEKVHVVGIGRNHTAPALERDWSRPRFLFVGMDWTRKNGDGVLRAFTRLREESPGARLDLVGGHPDVHAPGVTGHGVLRLDVPEQHERLDRLFSESTCFVMPSFSEAAGVVYVEAAAAGLPSIGTTAGGAGYLIGEGGIVVDPHDEDALLAAMRRLADPEVAERTGAAAKRRSELFTWDQVGKRLLRALQGHPAGAETQAVAS